MINPPRGRFYLDWGSLFLISLMFLWPAWLYGSWPGTGVDLYGTVWFYGWVRQSVEAGFDPSFTNWFFYPDGKEIFEHTGNNLIDAYASVPFQWILGDHFIGPFISFLVLINVVGLRWLLREMGGSYYVRWLMSVLWLFNPYVWSEIAMGRPTQVLLFPTFMALVFLYRMFHEDRRAWVGLGISVALQGWSYWFYGYFVVLFLTLVCLVQWSRGSVKWSVFIPDALKAGLVCIMLVSPAIWTIGHSAINSEIPGVGLDRSFRLSHIVEQLVPWMRGIQLLEPIGHPYFRTVLWGSVLGLSILFALRNRKWIVVALGMLIVSLGPVQTMGETDILNPIYLYLVQVLPFFERLWFPYRAAAFVFISLMIHLSEVQRSTELSKRIRIALPCLIVGAGVWDATFVHSFPLVHTNLPKSVAKECLDGPTIQIPIGFVHPTMTWQSNNPVPYFGGMGENGLIFLPSGYKRRLQNPFIQYLRSASLYSNTQKTYSPYDRERIEQVGFQYILWDRGLTEMELLKREDFENRPQSLFKMQANLIEKLGPPVCVDRQWVVFSLDSTAGSLPLVNISEDWTWQQPVLSSYEMRLRELGLVPK